MTTHSFWPMHITVIDNFMTADEHTSIKQYVMEQHRLQNKYPLCDYDHTQPIPELAAVTSMMMAQSMSHMLIDGQDPALFDLSHFQTHSVDHYCEALSHEYVMEPHHDVAEGGYYAMLYYVNVDTTPNKFVGGQLAIYKNQSSTDYPEGVLHVEPRENRFVMFPADLVHRIKPYFGSTPRVTIATLLRKERNYHQNKRIVTL